MFHYFTLADMTCKQDYRRTLAVMSIVMVFLLLWVPFVSAGDDPDWNQLLNDSPSYFDAKHKAEHSHSSYRKKHRHKYAKNGLDPNEPEQITPEEQSDVIGYTDTPTSYDIYGRDPIGDELRTSVRSFNRALEELPAAEEAVFSAQQFTLGAGGNVIVEEGDYIVNSKKWLGGELISTDELVVPVANPQVITQTTFELYYERLKSLAMTVMRLVKNTLFIMGFMCRHEKLKLH